MANHWEVLRGKEIVAAITPEMLMEAAYDYFKFNDDNPLTRRKTITTGKLAGTKMEEEYPRPYSVKAFCLHTGITEEYIQSIRQSQDKENDYYLVITRILYIIYVQNSEYATVGVYNPIFTARMLNLGSDEAPTGSVKIEIIGDNLRLSNSENEILEKLELENANMKIVE